MAANPLKKGTLYEVDPSGDLFVKVIQYNHHASSADGTHPVLREDVMKVSRKVLIEHSPTFSKMLKGPFAEATQDTITIEEHSVAAVELWFRVLHKSVDEESYDIDVKEIWEAIEFSQLYFIHVEKLKEWFCKYWAKLDKSKFKIDDMRKLLFPCQKLDHAVAFAYLSKRLAYEFVGHIQEINPTRHRHLHLQGRVIQQLNAAKTGIRNRIAASLLDPLGDKHSKEKPHKFCATRCPGYLQAQDFYLDGLAKTDLWPIHHHHRKSNKEIIESPGFVKWECKVPENACSACKFKLGGYVVTKTRHEVLNYWQGLCLDCMDCTNLETGEVDEAYWRHNEGRHWDEGCSISHERNTWFYSSWVARRSWTLSKKRSRSARCYGRCKHKVCGCPWKICG